MNFVKSCLFVSSNVDPVRVNGLNAPGGITLTSDLGRYLGVPVMHSRMS